MELTFSTLATYLDFWLTKVVALSTRRTTQRTYAELVRRLLVPALGRYTLRGLSSDRIVRAIDSWRSAGVSSRRARTAVEVLRTALRAAVQRGLLRVDPTANVQLPRYVPRPARWLSPRDAGRLLAAAHGHRYEIAVVLGLCGGLRRGEVGALRWQDIDLDAASLRVRGTLHAVRGPLTLEPVKTVASERFVPLSVEVVRRLRRLKARARRERRAAGLHFAPTDHVLSPGHGGPQWLSVLNAWLTQLLRRERLPHVTFQDLRHTAACLLLEAGAEPRTVMELLGHRRVAHTLLLYSHVRDDQKRAAIVGAARLLRSKARR